MARVTKRFVIRLKTIHDQSGLSVYRVRKDTGVALGTVQKFARKEPIVTDQIQATIVVLAAYYGVDWKDVVTIIDEADEESEFTAPLLAIA